MIYCKRHIIAAGFSLILPLTCWSEVPVVDESDNFAMIEEHQAREASGVSSQYDDPAMEHTQNDYVSDAYHDDADQALAKDDQINGPRGVNVTDNASLIDKIQSLQKEVQELRGQLEVQAHDLKLLQQQQVAFYKDLDARLSGSASAKVAIPGKSSVDLSIGAKQPLSPQRVSAAVQAGHGGVLSVSRANPADEQISYLAAYELVKNKRYDDALNSMNLFVQKYPRGGYTANAQYWLGELYLAKKDYAKAIERFDIVLKQFPTSGKSAASMLKVGYAYAEMGNKPEAQKYLQQVVRAYPNTPTAQLANSKLRAI